MGYERLMFWCAVSLYGVSALAHIFGLIAKAERLFVAGVMAAAVGFVPHTASIAMRWGIGGTTPFISISESLSLGVWVTVLILLGVQVSTRRMRALGVLVMPVAFTLVGWAGTLRTDPRTEIAPALQSGWLWAHIIGASAGFGAVLAAAGLALLYLLKDGREGGIYERLPSLPYLDEMGYRFVVGGFTLYGVMIVTGAFWANQAKGSYWAWDPVEVWSLVSWLIYGIYLHLRITFGWRGRRLAIYALVALAAMIVSYWGIPFTVETFHSGFRVPH